MSKMPGSLGPLRHPGFRLLVAGQLASNMGDAFYAVALPWYVLADHGGVLLLATVLAAYGVPRTGLLVVGGYASDRWRPWVVMMVADSVRAVAVAGLAVVAFSGPANSDLLVPIAVLLGAGEGLFLPGSFAIVPTLLPSEHLQAGNALTSGGTELATLIGPAVGGAVVALLGPAAAFGVDAISFVASAATLAGIRSHQGTERAVIVEGIGATSGVPAPEGAAAATSEHRPQATAQLTLGQFVASERALQVFLVVLVAANLGSGGMIQVALPALAHGPFHAGAGGYGALLAAVGGGALLGTVIAAQARTVRQPALIASMGFLIEAGCVAAIPYLGGAVLAGVALGAFGALNGFGTIIMLTAFQRWAPPQMIGRLMALLMFAALGAFPVSVILGGFVVRWLGPGAFFPLAATLLAVAILLGLTQGSWRSFGVAHDVVTAASWYPNE